jgi:hypothetical protein
MHLLGKNITLYRYNAETALRNEALLNIVNPELNSIFIADSMNAFMNSEPIEKMEFIEDDNRSAILPDPFVSIDGIDFFLSVKGIGSTTDPFSMRSLDRFHVQSLVNSIELKKKLEEHESNSNRFITGELWLRGSPYGGQGLEHATIAMKATGYASVTSINGFRIAPILRVNIIPEELERSVKEIFWYRRFNGKIVQEIRLVPSNVRIYFHSYNTIGSNAKQVFDLFDINTNEKTFRFEANFVRSALAMLTLFPRTMSRTPEGLYSGLDFYDVWLDKDAVIAPDGTIFFVDLEGIEAIQIRREKVRDKIEEQVFRSLYEFMFAYEQIDHERRTRFNGSENRKTQFEILLREAVKGDPFLDLIDEEKTLKLLIRNNLRDEELNMLFPILDR